MSFISGRLLGYLEEELGVELKFSIPPTKLTGGYETQLYMFQLDGYPSLPDKLVIRLYPPTYPEDSVRKNVIVHNHLSEHGYRTPRVHLLCLDTTILGVCFFVMDYIEGETMINANPANHPELLAETLVELHRMDPEPLVEKLRDSGFSDESFSGLASRVRYAENRVGWMVPAVEWLTENYPEETSPVICHGDPHFLNVLVLDDEVSGVIDWVFRFEDPCYDVASVLVTYISAFPVEYPGYDWEDITKRFMESYLSHRHIQPHVLDYFIAYKCLRTWIAADLGVSLWAIPEVEHSVIDIFNKITNLDVSRIRDT